MSERTPGGERDAENASVTTSSSSRTVPTNRNEGFVSQARSQWDSDRRGFTLVECS